VKKPLLHGTAPVYSPWKGTDRPAYGVFHALVTFLVQSVFLLRHATRKRAASDFAEGRLARETGRLECALNAFRRHVTEKQERNGLVREVLDAVALFVEEGRALFGP
jgi:hypothetical protein